MPNKNYKEALGFMIDASECDVMCSHVKTNLLEAIETFRELVKRATPIKPIITSFGGYECPNCNGRINFRGLFKYCFYCGQALDGSGETK